VYWINKGTLEVGGVRIGTEVKNGTGLNRFARLFALGHLISLDFFV